MSHQAQFESFFESPAEREEYRKAHAPVVGILLVGADECADLHKAPWLRDANEVETVLFRKGIEQRGHSMKRLSIDKNGRPYHLKAVLEHKDLPAPTRRAAERCIRVVRLAD